MSATLQVLSRSLVAVMLVGPVACGSDGGGSAGDGGGDGGIAADVVSLRIEPLDAVFTIEGDTPAEATYRAIATLHGGGERDVTQAALFALDDSGLGRFDGPRLASGTERGGRTRVRAVVGSLAATTSVSFVLRKAVVDDGAVGFTADPAPLFEGPPDPALAPTSIYPNDGVLVPPNLGRLELHFLPAAAQLFALRFENALTDVTVYLSCDRPLAGGCIYEPAAEVWWWIAGTNRGGEPVRWSVRGTDAVGTAVGTSASASLSFSQDYIDGALYYWTTSDDTAIMRFDFASSTQTVAEQVISTELTNGVCVGCHALSRDGTKMFVTSDGSQGAHVLLVDVATRAPLVPYDSTPQVAFSSWSPNGERFVGVFAADGAIDYDLQLYDGDSGAYVGSVDVGGTEPSPATHPDWSPLGDRIAYTKPRQRTTTSLARRLWASAIESVTDTAGVWSAPEVLVPAREGINQYYPTFSPDGALVAFNRSTCPGGVETEDCDAYEDPSARVWVVSAQAGAAPVELAKANAPGSADRGSELTSSFPKWAPFEFQRTGELGTRLMWITFSSSRRYGLRSPPTPGTLLWMAAVDPDRVAAGLDPSYPAFALPFQDLTTSNHTAQWTTKAIPID